MNVLKVFNSKINAQFKQEEFCIDNFFMIKSTDKFGKVELVTGHSIYFRAINTMEDAHKTSGMCFSWVEWDGKFDPTVKQYICSRIRGL